MTLPPGWMQTFTGRTFSPLFPEPHNVNIRDIAHALSNVCRFGGHVREFYSVAQHACIVSDHCHYYPLGGLNHDDNEAYMCDIPRPWKTFVKIENERYSTVEDRNLTIIFQGLGLRSPESWEWDEIKNVDTSACVTEALQLMGPLHPAWALTPENGYDPLPGVVIEPWDPRRAETEFLNRYEELTRERP